jgi:hypothetical protein
MFCLSNRKQSNTYVMKAILTLLVTGLLGFSSLEQEKKDTTRLNMGKTEIIIINHGDKEIDSTYQSEEDTIYAGPEKGGDGKTNFDIEAHWSGIDFGYNVLLNSMGTTSFDQNRYLESDPSKSLYINLNIMEHKFRIYKQYVGLTTGLGFNFNQVGFKNNYVLVNTADTMYAFMDTVVNYSKNKLRASYLQVPLLVEFNTHMDEDEGFYLAAGVIGGVRLASRVKRTGIVDGKEFKQKEKGTYSLNPFKLDATVRAGYSSWGVYVTYSLIPLFETDKTVEAYPVSFGLSYGF